MDKLKTLIQKNVIEINKTLDAYLSDTRIGNSKLAEAMRYSVKNGGKRIRGCLVLEFCHMFQGDMRKALPYAVAIELGHAASLIHDDMPCMDNDDIRRGVESCHVKYEEYTALLAGDALLSYAFEILSTNSQVEALINCKAVEIFSRNVGVNGMCLGQQKDLEDSCESIEELLRMYDLKTGLPIKVAAILGCFAAGIEIDDCLLSKIDNYAHSLGRAYQIMDDLSEVDFLDKQKKEKVTVLSFVSQEEAEKKVENYLIRASLVFEEFSNSNVICALPQYLYSVVRC